MLPPSVNQLRPPGTVAITNTLRHIDRNRLKIGGWITIVVLFIVGGISIPIGGHVLSHIVVALGLQRRRGHFSESGPPTLCIGIASFSQVTLRALPSRKHIGYIRGIDHICSVRRRENKGTIALLARVKRNHLP
jgi:hypothetical protein